MTARTIAPCPWPRWIAHRGAGRLAPENTLAAFRLGAEYGYRAYECDVKLSADDVPFLLHDATLDRTTDARGAAGERVWAELSRLDAGAWHSRRWAGEPIPRFAAVAAFCRANGHDLNIEIKPTPGRERETGRIVAREAERLWSGRAVPPLLSSFKTEALEGAREGAAAVPRALLVETAFDGFIDAARELGCVAVVCDYTQLGVDAITRLHAAGLWAMAYTVNDEPAARWLLELGCDVIITDAVDRFAP